LRSPFIDIIIEPKSIIDDTHIPTNIPDSLLTKNQSKIEKIRDKKVGTVHIRNTFKGIFETFVNLINTQYPNIVGTHIPTNIPGISSTKNQSKIEKTRDIITESPNR
tara:strand:- start:424 stop:744 length:321 start_codon:yes stop_codon:yes gene_type:complete